MKRILLSLIAVVSIHMAYAQDQAKPVAAADIKQMADAKKFKFIAKQATLPEDADRAGGSVSSEATPDNHIALTGSYSASLTPDSVASYLPYFDKSVTQAVGQNSATALQENPTKSKETAFDYQVKQKKDGKVDITVKPKNENSKITKYEFDLAPDGTAKLQATIENYKIVTYDGFFVSN